MPAISNGGLYMQAITYTGTGATQTINVGFTPDFVWIKSRSAATNHKLTDSVRGVTKALISNTTGAETTDVNGVNAFTSNGFTIGSDSVYNTSAATYVAWCWKAGGTAVSNTAGTITSSVSANPTAGFSVVTFTSPASGAFTVGHGLGVAPSMIIMKDRANAATHWGIYHKSIGAGNFLQLNTTIASAANASAWNNTTPTSTTFATTSNVLVNPSDASVAYCFAEVAGYSKFGSYTGNGSADGPFVFCGFRPRFVMVKNTSFSGTNWIILDTSRNTANVVGNALVPNSANAEGSTYSWMDILSNGFKMRVSDADTNGSGYTYIYAAFAENPFRNSLAR